MPTPTFTVDGMPLDVGLPGGSLNPDSAQALCSVEIGELQQARSTFGFADYRGTFKWSMGPQTRLVTWHLCLRCVDLATLNTIEGDIDELIENGKSGTLTDTQGNSHHNAIIRDYRRQQGYDVIRTGTLAGWMLKEGWITFEVLTP